MLVEEDSTPDKITLTGMAADAHANKLTIHPFTVRVDKLPKYAKDGDQLYDIIYNHKLNNLYFYYPALINKGQDNFP